MFINFIGLTIKNRLQCEVVVSRFFADMLETKNQGPKFDWEMFIRMAREQCHIHMICGLNASKKKIKLMEDYCEHIGEELVKRSGLLKK